MIRASLSEWESLEKEPHELTQNNERHLARDKKLIILPVFTSLSHYCSFKPFHFRLPMTFIQIGPSLKQFFKGYPNQGSAAQEYGRQLFPSASVPQHAKGMMAH